MTDNILTKPVLEMLAEFQQVLAQFGIDFYLVGAVARDIHFSRNPAFASKRATLDVDLAIMLADEEQFYAVKEALVNTGNFTAHPTEAIKLFYKEAIELDLLPFGDIENEYRETRIHKPRLFALDVPGFMELLPDAQEIEVGEGTTLKVCSLEGIVMLKLIAWDDKPARIKDVTDIDHIIDVYFDFNDMEIYGDYMDVMDAYDTNIGGYLQLVSARVIGRKIGALLKNSDDLKERVATIAGGRLTEPWQAIAEGIGEG
jgi:predicted nucleotidyltransferase